MTQQHIRTNDEYNSSYGGSLRSAQDENQGKKAKKTGVFDDVSGAAIIASALAAVTSLLLARWIGLAGSLIGAAVAAAASTFASQVYKSIISRSAEKMRKAQLGLKENMSYHQQEDYSSLDTAASAQMNNTKDKLPLKKRQAFLLIALLTAFLALILTAVIIATSTKGKGIGTKEVFVPATTVQDNRDEQNLAPLTDGTQESQAPENTLPEEQVPEKKTTPSENEKTPEQPEDQTDSPDKTELPPDEESPAEQPKEQENNNGSTENISEDPNKKNTDTIS